MARSLVLSATPWQVQLARAWCQVTQKTASEAVRRQQNNMGRVHRALFICTPAAGRSDIKGGLRKNNKTRRAEKIGGWQKSAVFFIIISVRALSLNRWRNDEWIGWAIRTPHLARRAWGHIAQSKHAKPLWCGLEREWHHARVGHLSPGRTGASAACQGAVRRRSRQPKSSTRNAIKSGATGRFPLLLALSDEGESQGDAEISNLTHRPCSLCFKWTPQCSYVVFRKELQMFQFNEILATNSQIFVKLYKPHMSPSCQYCCKSFTYVSFYRETNKECRFSN